MSDTCGCSQTYPQLVPGKVSHGPGCHVRISDTPITDANAVRGFDALRITKDEEQWVRAEVVRELERELNATRIIAGVASKERGEWAAERKDLRDALATLVGIEEADYAPWFIEPGSELGLALAAAKKALLIWRTSE